MERSYSLVWALQLPRKVVGIPCKPKANEVYILGYNLCVPSAKAWR
jgi:hypothetical protein